jgi:hypothetical protein
MTGVLSHVILFVCGHLASLVLKDPHNDLAGLTVWSLHKKKMEKA